MSEPEPPPAETTPLSEVRRVPTGFSLDASESIEMLLLQWHTPSPIDGQSGAWIGATANEIGVKQTVLTAVEKLISQPRANPMFVVTPELSLPLALVPIVDSAVAKASKPLVFIAGLEHMTLEQYATFAADFDEATTAANPQKNRRVNAAAIWIATDSGTRRYLQMKRGLADSEQNDLTHGREAFLFASPDQRDGRRLNFAVGICADFTNKQHVLQLRREMAKHADVLALDLMFLLQMNEKQDALQFRTAVAAYFDPPVAPVAPDATLMSTDKSALVFLNQAAGADDAAKFGRSAVHFHYNKVLAARAEGAPTFCIESHPGHDHHSAVFREDRPSAYLVEYVPLHRRNAGPPGSNEAAIFRSASYADLSAPAQQLTFTEIAPVVHWLLRRWEADEAAIAADAEINFRASSGDKKAAIAKWRQAWLTGIEWWRSRLHDDNAARRQLALLVGTLNGREPRRWAIEESVRLLLRAFVLIQLGTERPRALCGHECGNVTVGETVIAFVSGRRRKSWKTVVDQFYAAHRTSLDALGVAPLLIVQETNVEPPWNHTYELPEDVTGDGLAHVDDFTVGLRALTVRCGGSATLYEELCDSGSFSDACSAIAARINEVLS